MKHHWHIDPLPPPEGSNDNGPGFVAAFLLLAFVVVGPLIYFGPELRAVEAWILSAFGTVEAWILPIRDWLLGRVG